MKRSTNPQQMDLTARVAFAKVYPAIASHIVAQYGITSGYCLDAGSGPGSLAIALARITDLQVVSLDKESGMTDIAVENIQASGLSRKITAVTADVHNVPFDTGYFDLIVSRGSIFFWEDQSGAIRELYRVLKTGGVLYCGGGMGNEDIRRQVDDIILTDERFTDMREFWRQRSCKPQKENETAFQKAISEAGLEGRILKELSGIWIEITK